MYRPKTQCGYMTSAESKSKSLSVGVQIIPRGDTGMGSHTYKVRGIP